MLLKLSEVSLFKFTRGTSERVLPDKFRVTRFVNSSNPEKSVICLLLKSRSFIAINSESLTKPSIRSS